MADKKLSKQGISRSVAMERDITLKQSGMVHLSAEAKGSVSHVVTGNGKLTALAKQ